MAFSFALLPETTSLGERANRINVCFARIEKDELSAKRYRILVGRELLNAQIAVPKGEWKVWVAANIERSYRDCTKCMALAAKPYPEEAQDEARALDITQKAAAVTRKGANRTPNATSERSHLSLVDPTVDPVEEWLTLYRDMNLREQIRAKERFIKEFCHDTSKDERLA